MKAVKWIGIAVGALVVIVLAVGAYLAATFDPNAYKPMIVERVKRDTGRTLTIDGKIALTFFPKIGLGIGKVTLSEPNSPAIFARVDEAHVGVELLPLLSKHVDVDRVTLTGLTVDLVRYRDGHTNFDDLTGQGPKPAKPGEAPKRAPPGGGLAAIEVDGVEIENATIGWRNEADGINVRLTNVNLKTGKLANRVPGNLTLMTRIQGEAPKANLQLNVQSGYRVDLETQAVQLSSLDLKLTGDAQELTGIDAHLKGETIDLDPKSEKLTLSRVELTATAKNGLDAKVSIPRVTLAPDHVESQAISADVQLNTPPSGVSVKARIAPITAKGKVVDLPRMDIEVAAKQPDLSAMGTLTTPLNVDLDKQHARLTSLAGELTLTGKNIPPNTKASVRGSVVADWGTESANVELAVKVEDSNLDAKVAVAHWIKPAITFSLVADRLNVDRYFPPSRPAPAPEAAQGSVKSAPAAAAADAPIDLSPLKTLDATGTVKIGSLVASNVKVGQLSLALKAAGGKLEVNPISASLYHGTVAGSIAVNANDNSFAVKQRLANVSLGPLLQDATGQALIEGRGNVTLDLTASGKTVTALKKALAGTALLELKDGALKGGDLSAILRMATTMAASKGVFEKQADGAARTEFAQLTGTFIVKNGVAHNEDLQMSSPVLKMTGHGDVDIAQDKMDLLTKCTVTESAAKIAGKDLAHLVGIPVPIHVTGSLASPMYSVGLDTLVVEAAKGFIQRELDREVGGAKSGTQKELEALGGVLKGLLGKPK
jgi:AsmA protein